MTHTESEVKRASVIDITYSRALVSLQHSVDPISNPTNDLSGAYNSARLTGRADGTSELLTKRWG